MGLIRHNGAAVALVVVVATGCGRRPADTDRETQTVGVAEAYEWLARCPNHRPISGRIGPQREFEIWVLEGRQLKGLESAILKIHEKGLDRELPAANVCAALAYVGTSKSVPYLAQILTDADVDSGAKREAIKAMEMIGSPVAIPVLAQFLRMQDGQEDRHGLRSNAMLTLIWLGEPSVIDIVEAELDRPGLDPETASFVRDQLERLKTRLQGGRSPDVELRDFLGPPCSEFDSAGIPREPYALSTWRPSLWRNPACE